MQASPLFRILLAYANVDQEIGYTQGIDIYLLLNFRNEFCGRDSI
jgi:hypothetical protein